MRTAFEAALLPMKAPDRATNKEERGNKMLRRAERDSALVRRKRRVRKKVSGTTERPRLSVFRSNKNIYAQLIDDLSGETLASASTIDSELRDKVASVKKTEAAREVGKLLASRAQSKGFNKVVFDRNGNLYHGRVAAVAEGAREGGLEF